MKFRDVPLVCCENRKRTHSKLIVISPVTYISVLHVQFFSDLRFRVQHLLFLKQETNCADGQITPRAAGQ